MSQFSSYTTVELNVNQSNANLVSSKNLHSNSSVLSGVQKDWAELKKISAFYLVRTSKECVNLWLGSVDLGISLECLSLYG